MKVAITDLSKKVITLATAKSAKAIVKQMKEEDIQMYAQMTANLIFGDNAEVLKAKAEIAGNYRINNAFDDNSDELDVWLEFYLLNDYKGFAEVGIYITDLWRLDGSNNNDILNHMYIKMYKPLR